MIGRRSFLKTAAGLFIPAAPAIIRPASAQMWPFPGPGVSGSGGGGGYTGPGDVVSGAYAWWGLRAYDAAHATGSTPCLDLVDGSGNNPITINILSTGALDVASINSWVTTFSVATIRVLKWYDQTGNNRHLSRALASAPQLVVGAVGSFPATMVFATGKQFASPAGFTIASQPMTAYSGALITSNASIGMMLGNGNNWEFAINTTPALRLKNNTATAHATTLSTSTWYGFQGMYNGASSVGTVSAAGLNSGNPVNTTVSPGTVGLASSTMTVGNDSFSQQFIGSMVELGIWASDITGTSPLANLRAYGSF